MDQNKVFNVGALSQLKLKVNFANSMTASCGQVWGPRVIPDNQLLYVLSGKAKLILGAEEYDLGKESCVFYGPHCAHKLIADKQEPFTFASIHFDWDDVIPDPIHPMNGIYYCTKERLSRLKTTYILNLDGYGDITIPNYASLANLENLFMQIVREYRFEEHGYMSIMSGLLKQLLTVLLRHQIDGNYSSADRRKIAPALEMIRKEPHINWTMSELASTCGYHPTYFTALFKETTGYTPKHYHMLERIKKAKRLLIDQGKVEEVAFQLGYTSTHYFCRNFKALTGLTPTEFKLRSIEL